GPAVKEMCGHPLEEKIFLPAVMPFPSAKHDLPFVSPAYLRLVIRRDGASPSSVLRAESSPSS
ncbi:unnamed protein product, partial [Arctogadus glacialis]